MGIGYVLIPKDRYGDSLLQFQHVDGGIRILRLRLIGGCIASSKPTQVHGEYHVSQPNQTKPNEMKRNETK